AARGGGSALCRLRDRAGLRSGGRAGRERNQARGAAARADRLNRPAGPLARHPVAADVAVLASRDHVDRVLIAHVSHEADRGCVDAGHPARPEDVAGAVTELHLNAPAVHEVGLLLVLMAMRRALIAGRHADRVDAEGRDAERAADLAKAVLVAHRLDV